MHALHAVISSLMATAGSGEVPRGGLLVAGLSSCLRALCCGIAQTLVALGQSRLGAGAEKFTMPSLMSPTPEVTSNAPPVRRPMPPISDLVAMAKGTMVRANLPFPFLLPIAMHCSSNCQLSGRVRS